MKKETDIYVVRPGDTLAGIAGKLDISVNELSRLNNIALSSPLVVGQAILIPHLRKPIISLAYFQLNNLESLTRTLPEIAFLITYGALFQFSVTRDGLIAVPAEIPVGRFVTLLRSYNIIPLITITNLTPEKFDPDLARAVIGNEAIKTLLIHNLGAVLAFYGLAGVNIDFENVNAEDRELYTGFIRDLKLILGAKGYLVTLTVPPKNADDAETPAKAAYDYQSLGAWADSIFIMAYDWGYQAGPPMAVAPINEIQKVLSYAVSMIPPFKIIQGIPLYGYNWQLPFTPGTLARAVNLVDVYDLARRYGATIEYDPVAQSPNFGYTDETGNEHIVWFEDARSVRAKYAGVRNFGLGGAGFWSGQNYPYGFRQNWIIFDEMFQLMKGQY
jgi:spore germination protein